MGRVLSSAGAERRISFCTSVGLASYLRVIKLRAITSSVRHQCYSSLQSGSCVKESAVSVFGVPDGFSRISSKHFDVSTELKGLTSAMTESYATLSCLHGTLHYYVRSRNYRSNMSS